MKSTFDCIQIAYDHVKGSSLEGAVTGGLYKRRPLNSELEDIAVNALVINNEDVQSSIVNVNVFVPDIEVEANGVVDRQPDFARLEELANIGMELFKETWFDGGNFELEQQTMIADNESRCHYINMRIQFHFINA